MRVWKTMGQRRFRSRRGQVSAVATVLGLLLVVLLISNFVILQLPNQESQAEYQHLLQVEDQMATLQETILSEIAHTSRITLTSPVTLGSDAVPPFGTGSTSTLSLLQESNVSTLRLTSGTVQPNQPNWTLSSPCAISGHCSGQGTFYYNITGVDCVTSNYIILSGSTNETINIQCSHTDLTVDWRGNPSGNVQVAVNGSFDNVTFIKRGNSGPSTFISFGLYGEDDTFGDSESGNGTDAGFSMAVEFVGTLSKLCPSGNDSSTDSVTSLGAGFNTSLTWWNSVGYSTPPHATANVVWQNESGLVACAFTKIYATPHTSEFVSGLDVRLNNRYFPGADVALDQGAVILSQDGSTPIMVEDPEMEFGSSLHGPAASITLINFEGTPKSEAGRTTAAIQTIILSISRSTFFVGLNGTSVMANPVLNLTTLYPLAWQNFFESFPQKFFPATSISCHEPDPFAGSCWTPPNGVSVIVSATPQVALFEIISVTIGISLL